MDVNKVGMIVTVAVITVFLGLVLYVLPYQDIDTTVYGCGEGTYYHKDTNLCELFPPKIVWIKEVTIQKQSDDTQKSMDQIMEEQRQVFNP